MSLTGVWYRLQALVDWERADRARMRVDLAPEIDLMARLGQPHRQFKTVHVSGTKGKGSVCALIEAGLLHAGLRAGRYGSPHIEHVTERVSLLGQPIGERLFAAALTRALDARDAAEREGTPAGGASWFDVVTAAAYWSFAETGLQWAVVEVGMGGLLDSTNVVSPELAIVTNVGLEHTEVLGRTSEAIAVQKAGIIKRGRPVLTQVAPSTPAGRVLAATARAREADLQWVDPIDATDLEASNLALARAALARLGQDGVLSPARRTRLGRLDLPEPVALCARLPGRLEAVDVERHDSALGRRCARTTRVVLDGAHVGFAVTAAIDTLRRDPAHAAAPVVLLALAADKDARDIVGRIASCASHVVCTRLHDRASWDAGDLARLCADHGIAGEAIDDPASALARCLDRVPDGSWILVTGSLYLVGLVRTRLRDGVAMPQLRDPGTTSGEEPILRWDIAARPHDLRRDDLTAALGPGRAE